MKFHHTARRDRRPSGAPSASWRSAALLILGLAPNAMAAGPSRSPGPEGRRRPAEFAGQGVQARQRADVPRRERERAQTRRKSSSNWSPAPTLPSRLSGYAKRHGQLGIINGYAVELPDRLLAAIAADPAVFRLHYDRPSAKFNYRTSLTVGTQGRARHARPHRRGRRRRGHRLGHRDLARRPDEHVEHAVSLRQSARARRSSTSSTARRRRTTTTATARTSPASSRATATIRTARRAGAAPDASLISLKVLDGNGNGTIEQHHRGARLGAREPHHLQHPRRQHVGRRGDSRIVLDRPADAGGQARRRRRRRRRRRGRQLRQERGRPAAVRRHQRAGQRALGADGRRARARRARRRATDDMVGELQLARSDVHRLEREARPGRAGHRHGLAGRSGQHVLSRRAPASLLPGTVRAGVRCRI